VRLAPDVERLLAAHDYPGLAAYYAAFFGWHLPSIDPLPLLAVLLLVLYVVKRKRRKKTIYIPLTLGPVTVDLQPTPTDSIHTVIGGTSGLGKSTAVLPLLDLPVGVLVLALDNTRPIAEYIRTLPDGIEWSNERDSPGWGTKLDILSGPASIASEALVAGWTAKSEGDTGKYRNIARDRLWRIMDALDADCEPRTMLAIVSRMMADAGDGESNRACRDWARRIERLYRQIGDCLGDDLDLVQAMRMQKKVLLRLNSFLMPEESPMLGGMWLVQARRVAQEAGVPFVLIIEEAGQLGQYSKQIVPLSQAGRDRGVPTILLTQNMALLPPQVVNNTTVWVSFAQESKAELQFAAERVGLEDETLLKRSAFKHKNGGRGWAYVRTDKIDTTLVKIKQRKPRQAVPETQLVRLFSDVPSSVPWSVPEPDTEEPDVYEMLPAPKPEPVPVWIGTDYERRRIWKRLRRATQHAVMWHPEKGFWDGTPCLLWTGTPGSERPKARIGEKTATVYIETYLWSGGKIPESYTLDHLCGEPLCCDPEHLDPCTIAENNKRRSARKKALALLELGVTA
jgi:HNH endonuclease